MGWELAAVTGENLDQKVPGRTKCRVNRLSVFFFPSASHSVPVSSPRWWKLSPTLSRYGTVLSASEYCTAALTGSTRVPNMAESPNTRVFKSSASRIGIRSPTAVRFCGSRPPSSTPVAPAARARAHRT